MSKETRQMAAIEALYALQDEYVAALAEKGEAFWQQLSDAQHTLFAYLYLDALVEAQGFVGLIAEGWGEYVLLNPVADSLRRWGIKLTPKVLDRAKGLYQQQGAEIEALADEGMALDKLRARFADFEEWDAAYYEVSAEDFAAVAEYVAAHIDMFRLNQL